MKLLMLLLAIAYSPVQADDNKGMDWKTFSMNQNGQVFNETDRKELEGGFLVGDDNVQYFTWEGEVSNRRLYIEAHGNVIKLRIGKKWITRYTTQALSFPSDPNVNFGQHESPGLYIKSEKLAANTLICLDDIQPNFSGWPYTSKAGAYVLLDPMGVAILYKMPSEMASCLGLIRNASGKFAIPKWQIGEFLIADKKHLESPPPRFTIQYYQLERTGFSKIGSPIVGRYLSNADHTFNNHFIIEH